MQALWALCCDRRCGRSCPRPQRPWPPSVARPHLGHRPCGPATAAHLPPWSRCTRHKVVAGLRPAQLLTGQRGGPSSPLPCSPPASTFTCFGWTSFSFLAPSGRRNPRGVRGAAGPAVGAPGLPEPWLSVFPNPAPSPRNTPQSQGLDPRLWWRSSGTAPKHRESHGQALSPKETSMDTPRRKNVS